MKTFFLKFESEAQAIEALTYYTKRLPNTLLQELSR